MNYDRLLPYFRKAERAERCACGGFIVADPASDVLIEQAVIHHQRTIRHMDWRARFEEGGVFIVGRVVETPDGTFLEPLELVDTPTGREA